MLELLGLVLLVGAGWVLSKRYERHLGRQIGPWIASELKASARVGQPRAKRVFVRR
jgi:hypothetical protein